MSKRLILPALLALYPTVQAVAQSIGGAPIKVGLEVDAVPFATGGWYASGWVGRDRARLRLVATKVELPGAFVSAGWDKHRLEAQALLVDRFFRPGFAGPWVGAGLEHWSNRIERTGTGLETRFSSLQATAGGGWVFRFGNHFYLNPWAALHVQIAGDREAAAGPWTYHPRRVLGEASLKAGWQF